MSPSNFCLNHSVKFFGPSRPSPGSLAVEPAQCSFRPLEYVSPSGGQILASPVDVKIQERYRRPEGARFAAVAVLRSSLERTRDRVRIVPLEYPFRDRHRVAMSGDRCGPVATGSRGCPARCRLCLAHGHLLVVPKMNSTTITVGLIRACRGEANTRTPGRPLCQTSMTEVSGEWDAVCADAAGKILPRESLKFLRSSRDARTRISACTRTVSHGVRRKPGAVAISTTHHVGGKDAQTSDHRTCEGGQSAREVSEYPGWR